MSGLDERLRKLDEEIEALDAWTDRHPYPSGLDKLWSLCRERDQLRRQLPGVDATVEDSE